VQSTRRQTSGLGGEGRSPRSKLKLNIGCGADVYPGYEGVDVVPGPSVRYVQDLTKIPWSFDESSVEDILMHNVLEHLPDTVKVLEELHRILAPGGTVLIKVPYYNSYGAATDPTHVRFFSEDTMNYFTPDGATEHSGFNYYTKARFSIRSRALHMRSPLLARAPVSVQLFFGHHFATISDITWVLQAIK
jgi:SAM-dependent methyltransferase